MATSTISYSYNESGSWATITPYAGLYYSDDMGSTKNPITASQLPIVSTLTLYYKDATQSYCTFADFFNGSSTISYNALVVSGMGCSISTGEQASGSITVVTDAAQKSEAGGDPVSIAFAQPAPAPGQHVSGLTVNGSTTSPASIAAGGTAAIAYQYAADPPSEPVTLTFSQPEEGQTKINQVRVSVNGGALSTTSPVEIPAGSAAQMEYSYQPFDAYIGPTILQNVTMSPDTQEVLITPIVDNLGYQYYKDSTYTLMTKDQQYTIPTHKGDDNIDYLIIGVVVDGSFVNVCYCALIGDKWALYCPGYMFNSGQIVAQVISTSPASTSFILGKIENNILISVNHDNTTTPEVQ